MMQNAYVKVVDHIISEHTLGAWRKSHQQFRTELKIWRVLVGIVTAGSGARGPARWENAE
jgi:hypothetical protein